MVKSSVRSKTLCLVGLTMVSGLLCFHVLTLATVKQDKDNSDTQVQQPIQVAYHNVSNDIDKVFERIFKTLDGKISLLTALSKAEKDNYPDAQLRQNINIQKSIITFLSQPIRNEHNFSYLHNPESACRQSVVKLLNVVPSALGNFDLRNKLRSGKRFDFINNTSNHARMLFFLGTTRNETLLAQINKEAEKYGDIVQENYIDTYKNIRHKAMSMLKWAVTFCPDTKYVLRTDDDINVNLENIVDTMKMTSQRLDNFILAKTKKNEGPVRYKNWKVYISEQEYPNSTYPTFGFGALLGYPMGTVRLLYQAALRVKAIWLDDVFITALCASKVNVTLLEHPAFTFKH